MYVCNTCVALKLNAELVGVCAASFGSLQCEANVWPLYTRDLFRSHKRDGQFLPNGSTWLVHCTTQRQSIIRR